jgi:hypothetical protein
MTKPANEIVLTDIDLDFIEQSNDVKALRHMLRLLEEDGWFVHFSDSFSAVNLQPSTSCAAFQLFVFDRCCQI